MKKIITLHIIILSIICSASETAEINILFPGGFYSIGKNYIAYAEITYINEEQQAIFVGPFYNNTYSTLNIPQGDIKLSILIVDKRKTNTEQLKTADDIIEIKSTLNKNNIFTINKINLQPHKKIYYKFPNFFSDEKNFIKEREHCTKIENSILKHENFAQTETTRNQLKRDIESEAIQGIINEIEPTSVSYMDKLPYKFSEPTLLNSFNYSEDVMTTLSNTIRSEYITYGNSIGELMVLCSTDSYYAYNIKVQFIIKDINENTIDFYSASRYCGSSGTTKKLKIERVNAIESIMQEYKNHYESKYKNIQYALRNPQPTQQQNNAIIYFAWPSNERDSKSRIFIDWNGQHIGSIRPKEYIRISCPPGLQTGELYDNHARVEVGHQSLVGTLTLGILGSTSHYEDIYCSTYEQVLQYNKPATTKYYIEAGKTYIVAYNSIIAETKSGINKELSNGTLAYEMEAKAYHIENSSHKIANNQTSIDNNTITQPIPTIQDIISDVDDNIPRCHTKNDNTYVLIISNQQYNYLDPVSFAKRDGESFKKYCLNTLNIPERQIFHYTDATYGNMSDGISKMVYILNNFENAKAIVYYCGHGIPDEKTSQPFLIPIDGKGTNMNTCISLNSLYKTLSATKAVSITYFMDACFTGANKEGTMLVEARGVARAPQKETLSGKTIVFSASSGDETAMTLKEQGHGLFTYYLLKKLQETQGDVTYGELSDYIKKSVQKEAFLTNEKPQTPVVATSPSLINTWRNMKLK